MTDHAAPNTTPQSIDQNPLVTLSPQGLPRFDAIEPAHINPAIAHLIAQADAALTRVTAPDFPSDWNQLALHLDVAVERLGMAWGAISHLKSVAETPALREAYNQTQPEVTAFFTRMGANEALYGKYKAIDTSTLNSEQQQALKNSLRNFVLGGAELTGESKARFETLQTQQTELAQQFSEHALDATEAFSLTVTTDELAGLPKDVLAATAAAAQAAGAATGLHRLSLKMPVYLPVMQFAKSSALREQLYKAYVTRASDQAAAGQAALDNTPVMQSILALRAEEAQLLGYPHFAALSLAPKMAESSTQVMTFLRDLAQRARPYAERDLADMREFAQKELGIADPQAWDWPFIGERLKEARYAFSEADLKNYFPAPKVLTGLFKVVQTLFGVDITRDEAPVWHPAVQFFRITKDGDTVGHFYLDTPARDGKRGGAWMDDVRARWRRPDTGTLQTPVAHMVCNFGAEQDGRPALLTHDDVITLFHEFGHGLHHMLTQIDEHDVSGISGVEWDAVELPSQFMENFCWEWDVLQDMTAHVDTGAPLPRELYEKMLAAKNFQSGMQTLRQVEFALFDLALHEGPPDANVQATLDAIRREVAVLVPPPYNRMAHTFSHIFAGGYAAGYYSYKWAEVLSADAYAAFEEASQTSGSVLDAATGQRYLEEILQRGGSRPAMDSFKAFRGREPQIDALLRHQGMTTEVA
ncbi:M3 family metallopeptidase [Betaproteobacteria bacterium LSUCC0117]|nr:M3 family metallopeptidase [Betaproteobacteria bacterium LSUCC0117]